MSLNSFLYVIHEFNETKILLAPFLECIDANDFFIAMKNNWQFVVENNSLFYNIWNGK